MASFGRLYGIREFSNSSLRIVTTVVSSLNPLISIISPQPILSFVSCTPAAARSSHPPQRDRHASTSSLTNTWLLPPHRRSSLAAALFAPLISSQTTQPLSITNQISSRHVIQSRGHPHYTCPPLFLLPLRSATPRACDKQTAAHGSHVFVPKRHALD